MNLHAYPWHTALASQWLNHRERFAHAWLIHGMPGIGKTQFALAAAASLLCESPEDGLACGRCLACGWITKGNHPDLRRIRPDSIAAEEGAAEEEVAPVPDDASAAADPSVAGKKSLSREIRIEQIRAVENWFNQATHRAGYRVALIYPAESLNVVSANALLKVLEEPAPNTIFLLVSNAMDRLMPTLISRCRKLPLSGPSRDVSLSWLASQGVKDPTAWLSASGGAPVQAFNMSQQESDPCPDWLRTFVNNLSGQHTGDMGALAELLAKSRAILWLDALQRLSVDLSLLAHKMPARYYPGLQSALKPVAARAQLVRLSDLGNWINDQRRIAQHPLTPKLFAQAALDRFAAYCAPTNTSVD